MAMDDVAKFFHRVHNDEALRKQMRGTLPDGHTKDKEEVAREVVGIAERAGFSFTVEEYLKSLGEQLRIDEDEGVAEEMIEEIQSARGRCAWNSIISSRTPGGGGFYSG